MRRHRPGHFAGVATVVTKLLISAPHVAFFGEKDYQQLVLIRRMVRDLDFSFRIAGVPIVREPDGLALSSRNAYLSADERRRAPELARALRGIAARLAQEPGAVAAAHRRRAGRELENAGLAVEYLEIRDAETLAPVDGDNQRRPRVCSPPIHLGRTRLIDNVAIIPARRPTLRPQSRSLAMRAPSASAANFAHTTEGATRCRQGEGGEAAIGAGDDPLAADDVGVIRDPLGNQPGMLDEIGRRSR